MEELCRLIKEFKFFRERRKVYGTKNTEWVEKRMREHPPIPCFEWDDAMGHHVAGLEVTLLEDKLIYEFIFRRNGRPVTFLSILSSYRRMLANAELNFSEWY